MEKEGLIIVSLFDGMCCGRQAAEEAGLKIQYYISSEIKPDALKVSQHNYPDNICIDDVRKVRYENEQLYWEQDDSEWSMYLPHVDLFIGGSPCFTEDTLVLTKDGHKSIKDVQVGDYVLSHTGNWRKVLKTGGKMAQIRRLKGMGCPELKTTDNHPFYIREMSKVWNNNRRSYDRVFGNPEWKKAETLERGVSYWSNVCVNPEISNEPYKDEIFWYMIGRYTGDGWYRKYKRKERKDSYHYSFTICCGKHEKEELKSKFDEFGMHYDCQEERTTYKFRIYSMDLVNFVMQIGKGASNKIVHPLLWTQPLNHQKAYLEGLLDADGCRISKLAKSNGRGYNTVSKKLAIGVQQLITNVYKRPCCKVDVKTKPTTVIEGRVVNQKPAYSLKFKDPQKQDQSFHEDGYNWMPIRENQKTTEFARVYNLEVEVDNSYTANNIVVHNCQSFSGAMKKEMRIGLEDMDRSGLFYEYYRLFKEMNPTYFLLENVGSMKNEDKDVLSELMGVKPININSKSVTPQLRNRHYWTNIPVIGKPKDRKILLQSILKDGYTNREKARCLLESDSRPPSTPWRMFRRYYSTGFTTLIFKDEQHYHDCVNHFEGWLKGLTATQVEMAIDCLPDYYPPGIFNMSVYDGVRYMYQEELEACQGVRKGYTECLTRNQAAGVLGDGWSIPVISWILSFIPDSIYREKEDQNDMSKKTENLPQLDIDVDANAMGLLTWALEELLLNDKRFESDKLSKYSQKIVNELLENQDVFKAYERVQTLLEGGS